LLVTFLSTGDLRTHIIPLPARFKIIDKDALDLHNAGHYHLGHYYIFKDFLDSNHSLALDEQRYAVAALACLKILFGRSQPPVSHITWFSQCSRIRVRMENHPQPRHKDMDLLPAGPGWKIDLTFYWHLRTDPHNLIPYKTTFDQFKEIEAQNYRSNHLLFLLPKSGYSPNILNFARYRVFRFGYLHRKHPPYMKKAIFVLAQYIERVTGETDKVRACESIWGREKWLEWK